MAMPYKIGGAYPPLRVVEAPKRLYKRRKIGKKTSSSKKADKLFSAFIRARDGKCVRCERIANLQCSHFWPRGISATRYDPQNCDTLCYSCHYGNNQGWERAKQGEYRDFKIAQLGEEGYLRLQQRAKMLMPRAEAIKQFESFYASAINIQGEQTKER